MLDSDCRQKEPLKMVRFFVNKLRKSILQQYITWGPFNVAVRLLWRHMCVCGRVDNLEILAFVFTFYFIRFLADLSPPQPDNCAKCLSFFLYLFIAIVTSTDRKSGQNTR